MQSPCQKTMWLHKNSTRNLFLWILPFYFVSILCKSNKFRFFLCFLLTVFHWLLQNPFALLCTIFLHGACVFCIPCKKSQHAPYSFAPPRLIFLHDFCEKLKISVCMPTDGYFEEVIVLLRWCRIFECDTVGSGGSFRAHAPILRCFLRFPWESRKPHCALRLSLCCSAMFPPAVSVQTPVLSCASTAHPAYTPEYIPV